MTELSLHILDIVQNSISAKADNIHILVFESKKTNNLEIEIRDNGIGMEEDRLSRVTDPFFTSRTTRKVGLGLPLFKQAAETCGGTFKIESYPQKGTKVNVSMILNHIDRQPMGDIAGVIAQLVSSYENIDFTYSHETESGDFTFNTREIKEIMDGVPLNQASVIQFLREYIEEHLKEINSNC